MEEEDFELPDLPRIDKGPPPDCPICGDPMSFIDGDWACVDCNGELLGPETGQRTMTCHAAGYHWSLPSIS